MKGTADIYNTYEILEEIGRGSYASVHKAINKQTGEVCAIKKISSVTTDIKSLITEITIMDKCRSENIVRSLTNDCSNKEVLIVMEYCCGGSVKDTMRQLGRAMNAEQITCIVKDVLHGLDYLHANNNIHRDVKAANILLNEDGIAKLGDFGVSECFEPSKQKRSIIGTPLWLPPEVIKQDPYGTAIDIWSLGITIIEMGDGQPPYSEIEQSEALKEIANHDKPPPSFKNDSKWSPNLVEFVSICLQKDATKRKSARELLGCELISRAPSREVIRRLVAEVCSFTVNQTESSLFRKYRALLFENVRLLRIYEERKKKVVQVDQMVDSCLSIEKNFEELLRCSRQRNDKINEALAQLKVIKDEIQILERDKSDRDACLEVLNNRKLELVSSLNQIQEKLSKEKQRPLKLKALESK